MPYVNIRQYSDLANNRKTKEQIKKEEKKRNRGFLKIFDPLIKRAGGGGKLPK